MDGARDWLPAWIRADVDRRTVQHAEWRLERAATRDHRRAVRSMRAWALFAAAMAPVAAVEHQWGWDLAGVLALVRAGLSWQEARRTAGASGRLPVPSASAPSPAQLRRSAAAGPLSRGESAFAALRALVRTLPPGPLADSGRAVLGSAADVVDGLRGRAWAVVGSEAAARVMRGPAAPVDDLVRVMDDAVAGLGDVLAALGEVVAALPGHVGGGRVAPSPPVPPAPGPPAPITGTVVSGPLRDEAATLRGIAAGLRDMAP